ncbi:hypothetical protein NIES2111_64520 (plasmid) [Nostoc sp. NIES-2111]|nr:hypothetical protein NIES2111_64520 [Nostoc sp. NIES-2111]
MVTEELEIIIKIKELLLAQTIKNNSLQLQFDCDEHIKKVKPKVWNKLTDSKTNYSQRIVAISGKLSQSTQKGFVLIESNTQIFECSPKTETTIKPEAA